MIANNVVFVHQPTLSGISPQVMAPPPAPVLTLGKRGRSIMEQGQPVYQLPTTQKLKVANMYNTYSYVPPSQPTLSTLMGSQVPVSLPTIYSPMSTQGQFFFADGKVSNSKVSLELSPSYFHTSNAPVVSSISPKNKRAKSTSSTKKTVDGDMKLRRRRCNEWTNEEVVLLLHCTKLMINCELKTISQALFTRIKRSPGKCWGRAAEKKLKRMQIFVNWKTCSKNLVLERIDEHLEKFGDLGKTIDPELEEIARKFKAAEYAGTISSSTK